MNGSRERLTGHRNENLVAAKKSVMRTSGSAPPNAGLRFGRRPQRQ